MSAAKAYRSHPRTTLFWPNGPRVVPKTIWTCRSWSKRQSGRDELRDPQFVKAQPLRRSQQRRPMARARDFCEVPK